MNLLSGRMELIQQTPDELYGISFQNGNYFMEDDEDTYWIATTDGVFIYNRFQQQFFQHSIKSYATGKVVTDINVWGFIELPDSSVAVLTTRGEGLYYFDKQFNQIPAKCKLASYANEKSILNVRCGLRDKNSHLWYVQAIFYNRFRIYFYLFISINQMFIYVRQFSSLKSICEKQTACTKKRLPIFVIASFFGRMRQQMMNKNFVYYQPIL